MAGPTASPASEPAPHHPLRRLAGASGADAAAPARPLLALGEYGPLLGRSRAMATVMEQIERVAPTHASVLIEGETGTGKEVVAKAIHARSPRRDAPFVPVNCGAIPETLVESALFGHERGSFTGADRTQPGMIERAGGGTLFLDEITEMPPPMQVRLLRVLENCEVQRVGAAQPFDVDVRVVAATNRDPRQAVREGRLREDLYFRIAVFPIHLPPLRERRGDVALLAARFLEQLNRDHATAKRWAPGAVERLERLEWKGNVRELKNVVERAFILADDLLQAAAAAAGGGSLSEGETLHLRAGISLAEAARQLILVTLQHTGGDKSAAANLLGISVKTLYNRLNLYAAARAGARAGVAR
jgi:DNA-binding NtrC family response regulator